MPIKPQSKGVLSSVQKITSFKIAMFIVPLEPQPSSL